MKSGSVAEQLADLSMGEYREIASLDDRIVGIFKTPADSWLWERHPDGDELLQLIEGQLEITLLIDDDYKKSIVNQGEIFVVPKGVWHRPLALTDVSLFFVTPRKTETSQRRDPTTR